MEKFKIGKFGNFFFFVFGVGNSQVFVPFFGGEFFLNMCASVLRTLISKNQGTAVYTASWVAPKADVHSQQGFHYMGYTGEARVDQAHRGTQKNKILGEKNCRKKRWFSYFFVASLIYLSFRILFGHR